MVGDDNALLTVQVNGGLEQKVKDGLLKNLLKCAIGVKNCTELTHGFGV